MNLKIENIKALFNKTFSVVPLEITPISAHGSQRQYYRLENKKENIVCIGAYNEDRKENIAFLDYANQLINKGISVPKIFSSDLDNNIYLLEDLGEETLFDVLQKNNNNSFLPKQVRDIYYKVIEELIKIQVIASKGFDYTNAYPRKAFDRQSIAWDLNYFKYYFIKLSNIPYNEQLLEDDFTRLTNYLLLEPRDYFLYRDFQSRNIMIVDNKPFFIDFQGGRQGALQYDLASLLFDAKANLSNSFRQELLNYYIETLEKYISFNKKDFINHFYAYVYIRIMQAMGSYGYRGYFQGKSHFLKSIPYALNNIKWLEENVELDIDITYLKSLFSSMIKENKFSEIEKEKLKVRISSFSFKRGYPYDATGNGGGFVFDCRAIENPGRYPQYAHLTGKDKEVIAFLDNEKEAKTFFENAYNLVLLNIEAYLKRDFSSLMVCFGCTGGRHRSVYFAEKLSRALIQRTDIEVILIHQEEK